jgi:hypothetical protein
MQFLAEVCKMLKLSVKHFVKVVWQHIVLMHDVLKHDMLPLWVDGDFETIAVEVKGMAPTYTWEIIGIYRAPNDDMLAIGRLAACTLSTGSLYLIYQQPVPYLPAASTLSTVSL